MFAIVVNEKGGEQKRLEFDKPEVTIGRVQGNDIILPKGNVSKRHSRIVLKDGKFIIVDLKSTNGTYVNGRKITSPLVVKGSDKIYIGDFILSIEEMAAAGVSPPVAAGMNDEPPPPPPRKTTASIPPPPPRRAPAPMDDDLPPPSADMTGNGDEEGEPENLRPARPTSPSALPAPSLPPPGPAAARPTIQQQAARPPMESRPASRSDVPAMPRPAAAPAPAPLPRPAPAPLPAPAAMARPEPLRRPSIPPPARPVAAPVSDDKRHKVVEVMQKAASRLAASLPDLTEEGAAGRVERAAAEVLDDLRSELPPGVDVDGLARDLAAEVVGTGPLDDLMNDDGISEVSVPRFDRIFADRGGSLGPVPRWFSSADAVVRAAERLMTRAGRLAELEAARVVGLIEARLENGWVLRAALPPLSARGASLSLRRSQRAGARLSDLVGQGFVSQGMADFLELAVKGRRNLVISGPAGSGRTTLLSALFRGNDNGARLVSVEEAEELDLGEGAWTPLVGVGERARQAIGLGLRMRPDHLIVGDVRGAEAFDLVAAMAGGADGIVCAVTAGSARDAAGRMAQMARLAPEAPDAKILAGEIARGVHVVVHLGRSPDGEPRVVEVVDNTAEGGEPIFTFKAEGGGRFAATGHVPAWAEGASPAMFRG
jgi:pilus assembly protein CpaF